MWLQYSLAWSPVDVVVLFSLDLWPGKSHPDLLFNVITNHPPPWVTGCLGSSVLCTLPVCVYSPCVCHSDVSCCLQRSNPIHILSVQTQVGPWNFLSSIKVLCFLTELPLHEPPVSLLFRRQFPVKCIKSFRFHLHWEITQSTVPPP